jgi:hypothetical protein
MTSTMYDSAHADEIPADAGAVAGYIDGNYPSYSGLVARFGTSVPVISITVLGAPGARVADVEAGNLTPGQGAAWAQREIAAGRHPTLYYSLSNDELVVNALNRLGVGQTDRWVADWTYKPHMIAGSVATQWANPPASGGGFDLSTAENSWLGIATPPNPGSSVINGKGSATMASLEDDTFIHVWGTIPNPAGGVTVLHWWQYLPGKGQNPADDWFVETMPVP